MSVASDHTSESHTIHIALAADAKYAMPLSVVICSAAWNCDRRRRLVFHVIQNGMDNEVKGRIEASLQKTGFPDANIQWIPIELDQIADLRVANTHLSALAYGRLLIPLLLATDLAKVLYLDSDVVVLGDVAELWDRDIGAQSVLAARDLIACVGSSRGIADYRELGISPDAKYFNSGVLLMNLSKWRTHQVSSRVFQYIRDHRSTIRMEDQEGLNAILFDDWGELPFSWNWQIPWRMYRRGKKEMPWNPNERTKNLVHFTTNEKPWLPGCDIPERRYFFEYLDRTAWAGWRVPLTAEIAGRAGRAVRDLRDTVGAYLREHEWR
jgi:lipopolysaccharide biosynthesis glycosyltransferase